MCNLKYSVPKETPIAFHNGCSYDYRFIINEQFNNKYRRDYDKNKEWSYLKYWDVNNLFGSVMSQNFPVNEAV